MYDIDTSYLAYPRTMRLRPGEGVARLQALRRNLLSLCITAAIHYPEA